MNFQNDEEIEFFIMLFETWKLPAKDWTHSAHIIVATYYLIKNTPEVALQKIRKNIKAYNVANGGKNTDSEGYHETVTVFYMQQIKSVLEKLPSDLSMKEKIEEVLSSDLIDTNLIFNFYGKEQLLSKKARLEYVAPDHN
jgi:hypothetical protein